jgi:hypothetical protein
MKGIKMNTQTANKFNQKLRELEMTPADIVILSDNELYESDLRALTVGNIIINSEMARILDNVFSDFPGTWESVQARDCMKALRVNL